MDVAVAGGVVRAIQGLTSAAPTLLIGLFIAAVLKYYLGPAGVNRLFGGQTWRSLPQSWLIGMLLPVCSIGVLPILREMKRVGVRPGAITAFALSAPLFNPLSILYGLTLSRPFVIVGFALASLAVVTILGALWDRRFKTLDTIEVQPSGIIGLKRLGACLIFGARELCGPTGVLALVACLGGLLLGTILPHGALQSSVEQLDPLAPAKMALVAVPIYATPMLTMSQLGMMFAHGNSPGAAFCLLLLGTGVNLATILWVGLNYGLKPTAIWFTALIATVLAAAYAVDRPLIPPGIEPAGHTHAFDIYTNPFAKGMPVTVERIGETIHSTTGMADYLSLVVLASLLVIGVATRSFAASWVDAFLNENAVAPVRELKGFDRVVSPAVVGATCLIGLIALSIVGCYAYYPAPDEVLEEMRLARTEAISGAISKEYQTALHWIPILDEWSRKLEVGTAIRRFELRPYQQMQTYLLRKKLELLEHAVEHELEEARGNSSVGQSHGEPDEAENHEAEIKELVRQISATSGRIVRAFQL